MADEFSKQLNEAMAAVRDVRLASKTDDDLHSMLRVLRRYQASQHAPEVPPMLEAIENELARRQVDKGQSEQRKHHEAVIGENQKILTAIQKLEKTHWTLTPTFWVSVAVLVVATLSWLFPIDRHKSPVPNAAPLPAKSNLLATPTNSPPTRPVGQQ